VVRDRSLSDTCNRATSFARVFSNRTLLLSMDSEEVRKFIIDTPFSSHTTVEEKYERFMQTRATNGSNDEIYIEPPTQKRKSSKTNVKNSVNSVSGRNFEQVWMLQRTRQTLPLWIISMYHRLNLSLTTNSSNALLQIESGFRVRFATDCGSRKIFVRHLRPHLAC